MRTVFLFLYFREYYFSVENLCKDLYLRGKMDTQGFVSLGEIVQFNRIRRLNAPLNIVSDCIIFFNETV